MNQMERNKFYIKPKETKDFRAMTKSSKLILSLLKEKKGKEEERKR